MYDEIKAHRFYGLDQLEIKPGKKWNGNYPLTPVPSQGRIIASPIAFISKVMKTVSYTHPDSAALSIAAGLMDNLYLHTSLREQGGAYGGGAVGSPISGTFYFYSYRDPNILSSLNAFQKAIENLLSGDFEDQDIEEAKLEMIQSLDMPAAPGSRGDIAYAALLEGRTQEIRQEFRDKVLAATRKDIIEAVRKHVVPQMDVGATIVFAGRELLEKENAKLVAKGLSPLPLETV